jgi:CDP-diacylglycerol--glycerol-3-phosphate 3-phosphatidyltransferase
MNATSSGVVIEASMFGKLKTCVQIAAILAVIAVPGSPLWVSLLVYLMVAITLLSGLDYFRRATRPASSDAPPASAPESRTPLAPDEPVS